MADDDVLNHGHSKASSLCRLGAEAKVVNMGQHFLRDADAGIRYDNQEALFVLGDLHRHAAGISASLCVHGLDGVAQQVAQHGNEFIGRKIGTVGRKSAARKQGESDFQLVGMVGFAQKQRRHTGVLDILDNRADGLRVDGRHISDVIKCFLRAADLEQAGNDLQTVHKLVVVGPQRRHDMLRAVQLFCLADSFGFIFQDKGQAGLFVLVIPHQNICQHIGPGGGKVFAGAVQQRRFFAGAQNRIQRSALQFAALLAQNVFRRLIDQLDFSLRVNKNDPLIQTIQHFALGQVSVGQPLRRKAQKHPPDHERDNTRNDAQCKKQHQRYPEIRRKNILLEGVDTGHGSAHCNEAENRAVCTPNRRQKAVLQSQCTNGIRKVAFPRQCISLVVAHKLLANQCMVDVIQPNQIAV